MHKIFKVRYKEGDVYIAISFCVHKLYSILETGFVIKQVQMNLQSIMMLDHMSRSMKKENGDKTLLLYYDILTDIQGL